MILTRVTGRSGQYYYYSYFFCRGAQEHTCDTPYSSIDLVGRAIEEHYKSIQLRPEFVAATRAGIENAAADERSYQRLLKRQLNG